MRLAAAVAALLAALICDADAASYRTRQKMLTELSGVFGGLHFIRRTCGPGNETDVWRERMKQLVRLEDPSATQREAMIEAFNTAYRDARRRFPDCTAEAANRAASLAADGERLTEALRADL
ncbi:MAG: TIGR02301 family protein [Pseudomonadota bacterium]